MIRQLFKDSVVYGLASILSQGIPILIVPVYTRFLSPDSYGGLDMLTVFASLINLTVALEISQGLARSYADTGTDHERSLYASTAFWFSAAAYSLFAIISLVFSGPLSSFLLDGTKWEPVFRIAVMATALNGIFLFLQNQLRWILKPKAYAVCSVAYAVLSTGIGILLVTAYDSGVAGIFYGQIIGALAGGLLAWFPARYLFKAVFSMDKCKEMLIFSTPLVPSSISVLVAVYVDRIAIKQLMTLADLGVYAVGFRIASVVNLLMVGLYSALTPLIYRHYNKESTPSDIARIFRFFLYGTLPLMIALSLFSAEIVGFFAAQEYAGAWLVIPPLAFASVTARMYIFAPGLDIAKKTGKIALINLMAASTNAVLVFLMIPHLGITGAALATLSGSLLMFILYMALSQKLYPVPHDWRLIAPSVIICVLAMAGGYLLPYTGQFNAGTSAVKMLIMTVSTIIIVRLLKKTDRGMANSS